MNKLLIVNTRLKFSSLYGHNIVYDIFYFIAIVLVIILGIIQYCDYRVSSKNKKSHFRIT